MMSTPNANERKPSAQRCTNCGFDNEPGRPVCHNCGVPFVMAATVFSDSITTTPTKLPANGAATLALNKRACPQCGHANMPAAPRCTQCGTALDISDLFSKPKAPVAGATTVLPERSPVIPVLTTDEVRAVRTANAQRLGTGALFRFEIAGATNTITVRPKAECIIGRRDPISNSAPDVDLTSFAAYRMGISRRHAALRVADHVVELIDLGSSNGTFVNGQRLNPHQPQVLRSGDEIGLGRMQLRIHFQQPVKSSGKTDA